MKGPSRHLSWNELACWNRLGKPWGKFAPGQLVAAYPQEWRETRAFNLGLTFEEIRRLLGGVPIGVNSAFRPPEYNAAVGGAKLSQHVQGRALDIVHSAIKPGPLFEAIRELQRQGKLPLLGGLGKYKTFVHIDVRPKLNGRLSVW